MKLKPTYNHAVHISHFHNLVSAYETNKDTVDWLVEIIEKAIKVAKETGQSQIVDQDSTQHIFIVHPTSNISLYREICTYEIVKEG